MKKLMLAATAAVVAANTFAICGDEDPVQNQDRAVYLWSFSGKTTKGVWTKGTTGDCGDTTEGCVARIPTKLTIKGWEVICNPTCATVADGLAAPYAQAFWEVKPYKADIPDAALADVLINVIGKKPTKAEGYGKFTGTVTYGEDYTWSLGDGLVFAGFGKYNKKTGNYTKIAGNFAGSPVASWYIGSGNECKQTSPWNCTTLALNCDEKPNTVAFGKWNVKYSKKYTKKAIKGVLPKTPSYATTVVSE